jgi:hypothetical protein
MKKMLLKFSNSLLSREQTKGIKGGDYPSSGGGGATGTPSIVTCYKWAWGTQTVSVTSCSDYYQVSNACNYLPEGGWYSIGCQ